MDADFSHDPKYLPVMLDAASAEADLVIGSRYVAGGGTVNWGPTRKVISRRGGLALARTISASAFAISLPGFSAFARRAAAIRPRRP